MKAEKRNDMQKETLIKVLKYIRPYRFLIALTILMAVVSVILTLYLPILTGDAVDRIAFIADPSMLNVDTPAIWAGMAGILQKMGIVVLLTAFTQWIMNVCNNRIVYNVIRDIRKKRFRGWRNCPLSIWTPIPTGIL